ncbi:hypothetical protein ANAPRD1_00610 [Anaplasma phagocytophilum]|nr:hypothetical protein ANAPRD1_00610 [Anaplasma phagocytophilum]
MFLVLKKSSSESELYCVPKLLLSSSDSDSMVGRGTKPRIGIASRCSATSESSESGNVIVGVVLPLAPPSLAAKSSGVGASGSCGVLLVPPSPPCGPKSLPLEAGIGLPSSSYTSAATVITCPLPALADG